MHGFHRKKIYSPPPPRWVDPYPLTKPWPLSCHSEFLIGFGTFHQAIAYKVERHNTHSSFSVSHFKQGIIQFSIAHMSESKHQNWSYTSIFTAL